MNVRPASRIRSTPIRWLWPNRLAQGKFALLDGDPGIGKSTLALDLAARISTGRPFPDETPSPGPANVLVFNAEDTESSTLCPRLESLAADLSRVYLFGAESHTTTSFHLPRDIAQLDKILRTIDARLLVLDPIVAFLDGNVTLNDDASIRRALEPLAALAERHRCAILMIRHLNKNAGRQALYRGSGSIGLMGLCRSAWLLAKSPDAPRQCIFAQLKNNLSQAQPSLAVTFADPPASPPLTWTPSEYTADHLLARGAIKPPSNRIRARRFLRDQLKAGPRSTQDIWKAALEADFSRATLFRARKDLRIRTQPETVDGVHLQFWLLPEQHINEVTRQPLDLIDLDLQEMSRQFPSATPIDKLPDDE